MNDKFIKYNNKNKINLILNLYMDNILIAEKQERINKILIKK